MCVSGLCSDRRVALRYVLQRDPILPAARLALDPDQERVAAHRGGPLLVLAGPGTGKTATLIETVARRVEAGTDPAGLLLLTFSRRAAAELRERLARRLGGGAVAPAAWTFHSFCLALLTEERARELPGSPRLRLLSGPEQEVVIRDLLRGDADDGRPWPSPLNGVLGTRGLAAEVRALVARAQLVGLDPATFAAVADRPEWHAVADFYGRYLDAIEAQGALDYAELVARAASLAARPAVLTRLRARFAAVWVDEYQDTDPAQERLLRALAGDGGDLTVVGDPDQSIYAFRGADVAGIEQFPARFPTRQGKPAPVIALRHCRRSGPVLRAASRRVAAALPPAPDPTHRALRGCGAAQDDRIEVLTFASAGAEAEHIADLLRRAHLDEGVSWSQMAILVRSGTAAIPYLRRVLGGLGVPVEVAGDELPIGAEAAVAPLLLALRCASDPGQLSADRVRVLLTSPLVGADTADLRRLGRALRAHARAAHPDRPPEPSADLVRRAVLTPSLLGPLDEREAGPARRLLRLLSAAESKLEGGGSPAEALWAVWAASPWREKLADLAGGPSREARAADRDLDAVVALFDAVGRTLEQRPGVGTRALLETLEAQQIPAAGQDERVLPREGVRLLTAHRSKGLEWELVVVCGVQEGTWPDLRPRGSLLQPDALGPNGAEPAPTVTRLLADERRLFYVACTRARNRLVVTAVATAADDGERPSRFLTELGPLPVAICQRPLRPRTLAGLVAALRHEALDPAATQAARQAAAARLAQLAAATDHHGRALVAAADPDRWWGLLPRTTGRPYDPGPPLGLSASTVTGLGECPLRWYLAHEVRADAPATTALGFGKVIHAVADLIARGLLAPDPAALAAELDRVWPALGFDAPWHGAHERDQAEQAMTRLARHVASVRDRELVGSEADFDMVVELASGPVRLKGRIDRVEIQADATVVVVDLKTGKRAPSGADLAEHPQLALYQYVVESGRLADLPAGTRSGGGELWQLRMDGATAGDGRGPKVQRQSPPRDHEGLLTVLDAARRQVVEERFPATPGRACGSCGFRVCCPAQQEGRGVVA